MQQPDFNMKEKFDFLTQLLSDEMFKDNVDMILDECMTFIGAATQTTSFLINNALYYLMKNPEVMKKLKHELQTNLLSRLPPGADLKDERIWQDLLLSQENAD
jgi:cytochrome P450